MATVSITLNGVGVEAEVEPRTHLADFIREHRNLTGTHLGCEHGVCGACTVLIDGAPARSCITYAVACDGASITTIEGLDDDVSAELREAFSREHALQCGYCTPGMLVSAWDAVLRLPEPDEHEIRVLLSGNLCRCTGYVGIVRAVKSVIADRRARGIAPTPTTALPALGPVGSAHPAGRQTAIGRGPNTAAVPAQPAVPVRKDSRPLEEWRPQVTMEQRFTVHHPPEVVWAFLGHPEEVAACLPGAKLVGTPTENYVEGLLRVRAGPIAAEFAGFAEIERDVSHYAGMIRGQGKDNRSGSATRGEIAYKLSPEAGGSATRVDVTVGYTLTGMLAQFSRSGLIHDVANRLTAAFATNLEARLSNGGIDKSPPVSAAELNLASLVMSVVRDRIGRFLRRMLGQRKGTSGQ
jgi:aerobic carbon-monoxide dehydrogenase small subunit